MEFWISNSKLEKALYACWCTWNNRNNCIFHNRCSTVESLVFKAEQHATYFEQANHVVPFSSNVNGTWIALPLGFYKLNVDVGFSVSDKRASCGMVIRDCQGQVILSASKAFSGFHSALQAELRAILFGLEMAHQRSLLVHYVESDCQLAIQKIKKGSTAANELAHNVAKAHSLQDDVSV
ncbi:hypothetical protein PTKIN_Ptkin11bG0083900 [Pterospermum kingtungense]